MEIKANCSTHAKKKRIFFSSLNPQATVLLPIPNVFFVCKEQVRVLIILFFHEKPIENRRKREIVLIVTKNFV